MKLTVVSTVDVDVPTITVRLPANVGNSLLLTVNAPDIGTGYWHLPMPYHNSFLSLRQLWLAKKLEQATFGIHMALGYLQTI